MSRMSFVFQTLLPQTLLYIYSFKKSFTNFQINEPQDIHVSSLQTMNTLLVVVSGLINSVFDVCVDHQSEFTLLPKWNTRKLKPLKQFDHYLISARHAKQNLNVSQCTSNHWMSRWKKKIFKFCQLKSNHFQRQIWTGNMTYSLTLPTNDVHPRGLATLWGNLIVVACVLSRKPLNTASSSFQY